MGGKAVRETVDLAGYPDLVVIELGLRVNSLRGLGTMMRTGPQIRQSVQAEPDGLLCHWMFLYSLAPPHVGIRQYWRDFEALERWARDQPHRSWWKRLLADPGGTGFWHETYFRRGGVEAIYLDMAQHPIGLGSFAPRRPARRSMFSARQRLGLKGGQGAPAITEEDFYR
jgi:Domain of unknown function (DUF4188)